MQKYLSIFPTYSLTEDRVCSSDQPSLFPRIEPTIGAACIEALQP